MMLYGFCMFFVCTAHFLYVFWTFFFYRALINQGLVCHHFFTTMLVFSIAKFHIGLILRRWYTDASLSSVPAISVASDNEFGIVEHIVEVNLSHLEGRGHHVFTKEVYQENNNEKKDLG